MAKIDHESRSNLRRALRAYYPLPQYAVLYEVANGMGETFSGYADAVVMGLFPSRGLDIHGIEIKTNRRDWLSELRKPRKSDRIAKFCDYWWLLIGDESVAKLEEVPEPWGLYAWSGSALKVVKRPKKLKAVDPDREFVGAMLRRANEMADRERERSDKALHDDKFIRKIQSEAQARGKEWGRTEFEVERKTFEALKKQIALFEEKSGISINAWNGGQMGEAVRQISLIHDPRDLDGIERDAAGLEAKVKDLKDGIVQLKQAASLMAKGNLTV